MPSSPSLQACANYDKRRARHAGLENTRGQGGIDWYFPKIDSYQPARAVVIGFVLGLRKESASFWYWPVFEASGWF
jgi:hypothetical protein